MKRHCVVVLLLLASSSAALLTPAASKLARPLTATDPSVILMRASKQPRVARDLLGRRLGKVSAPETGGLQLGSQSVAGKAVLALALAAFAKMALAIVERAAS
jgi:hypothetical protein